MKQFDYFCAESFADASESLRSNPEAQVLAGGTDLLTTVKDEILETSPSAMIDLKSIPGADYIREEAGTLKIGALTTLTEIAESDTVREKLPGLAEAAYSVASPLIRNLGTVGGNLCQDVRCWYYRYPHEAGDRLICRRKGGEQCYAIKGKNRFHSVFGGMRCGGSNCATGCPASTDIPGYMAKIRAGDLAGAAELLLRYNPMPMLTARVCPHPCQDHCSQRAYGDSVNIHCVERALGDYIMEHADEFYQPPKTGTGKRAAVVGAGPAGLSAAFYLRQAGHAVTVFEKQEKAGGVLQYGIPHYRLPKKYVDFFAGQLAKMGVEFRFGTALGTDVQADDLVRDYDTVFFGTGAWKQPILGLEGENLTQFGLNFLVEVNRYLKGVIGDEVLVCGGGNVAMDVALTAVRLGAKRVKLVCLEQEQEMPASAEEVARAREEGVELFNGWGLARVLTGADGRVRGLEAKKCVAVRDAAGRFSPQYDENERMTIDSDCIILATGQAVDLSFLGERFLAQVKSERGLYDVDPESFRTKTAHVYAGGDAATGPNIAIRAVAAGRIAARSMSLEMGVKPDAPKVRQGLTHFDAVGIQATAASKPFERPLGQRTLTEEDSETLSRADALREASRCMNCGCYAVAPSDLAPILVAAGASIRTTARALSAQELFCSELRIENVLTPGELVTEIAVPIPEGAVSHYDKFRLREAIDWAIVSLASILQADDGVVKRASLVLGGAAPVPVRLGAVEDFLTGKRLNEDVIRQACQLAVADCTPMGENAYKVEEIKALLTTALKRVAK